MARSLQKSLTTSEEQGKLTRFSTMNFESQKNLRKIPTISPTSFTTSKGIAYHHSGLIPILKEVIEILFAKGLIKILFATETFAVGVNMPTKTVIFPKLSKYSNKGFRFLRTMNISTAGRAGRRGLDKFGTVIILPFDELMEYVSLKKMMTGKSPSINSKFKLTYQFLLKNLRILTGTKQILNLSLMSKDNEKQIESYKRQLVELKEKHVLNIPNEDLKNVKEYKTVETLDNFVGIKERRHRFVWKGQNKIYLNLEVATSIWKIFRKGKGNRKIGRKYD